MARAADPEPPLLPWAKGLGDDRGDAANHTFGCGCAPCYRRPRGRPKARGKAGALRSLSAPRRASPKAIVARKRCVPLERLDELVRLVSELVINRTAFEQRMTDYIRMVEELRGSIDRMRNVAGDLQEEYEVSTLGGGRGGVPWAGKAPMLRFAGVNPGWLDEHEFDELEFDRYTKFHLLSRSLVETSSDINTVGNELNTLIGDFDTLLNRQGRLSRQIQNRLMRARMVPLDSFGAAAAARRARRGGSAGQSASMSSSTALPPN